MELWELVIAVAGGITVVLSAWGALLRTRPGRRVDRWIREGMAHDRQQLIAEVLDEVLPRHLREIHKQLVPNGGSSMRDELRTGLSRLNQRLDRTDAAVARLRAELEEERELNARGRRGEIDRRHD